MVLLLEEGSCYRVSECVMGRESGWRDSCHTLVMALSMCCLTVADKVGFGEGPERPHTLGRLLITPSQLESRLSGFPAGPGVKNPPADAGDMGSTPVQKDLHATGQLSTCTTTAEPVPGSLSATNTEAHAPRALLCNKRSLHNEKPGHHN